MCFRIVSSLHGSFSQSRSAESGDIQLDFFQPAPHKRRSIVISDENLQLLKNINANHPSCLYLHFPYVTDHFISSLFRNRNLVV